jgi:RNA-directed DNA polymerase
MLANIYLHYVFDLWIEAWRKKVAKGDVIVVRYADDLVVGFESRAEADEVRAVKKSTESIEQFISEILIEAVRATLPDEALLVG